ncbi:MAG TPA: isopentenyl-diphosphate Delta-isomerase [Chitinophagaceae bacterium]|nr:isopentenyl-diphosphate Delta-isomerase [Chitinophagaceae bacterium]
MKQEVLLVTEQDEALDSIEKMEAHQKGLLHRAFSVFIFNKKGELLLQQRAVTKYHGALLWSNTCCSHPYIQESVETAAARRLQEELGFTTNLKKIFSFIYRAEVENGLIEHEFDHVFAGEYEGEIFLNPAEVRACEYRSMAEIKVAFQNEPGNFTSWFRIVFPRIEEWWYEKYGE